MQTRIDLAHLLASFSLFIQYYYLYLVMYWAYKSA